MAWTIEYADTAIKQLRKLGKPAARRILYYMDERIARLETPRGIGKALTGSRRWVNGRALMPRPACNPSSAPRMVLMGAACYGSPIC